MAITWSAEICKFVVEDDTAEGKVNHILLANEINADSGMTTEALYLSTNFNDVTQKTDAEMTFEAEPTSAEKTIVEGLIAAHEGTESSRDPQFFTNTAEETSTDSDWETVITGETTPLREGNWQLDISLELKSSETSLTSAARARLIAQKLGGTAAERAQWVSNLQLYDGKSARIPFTASEADKWEFGVQLRQVGSVTAAVQRMRVSLVYEGSAK